MALATELTSRIVATQTSPLDMLTPIAPLDVTDYVTMATGTGTGQADMLWTDSVTLAASGTADLDLAGSLVGAFGTTLTFVKLKLIRVFASASNTNNVQVTRPASNGVPLFLAAGDGIAIGPGGCFTWASPGAGVTVTAGTGDLITFTNSAGTTGVTYTVVLVGTSA